MHELVTASTDITATYFVLILIKASTKEVTEKIRNSTHMGVKIIIESSISESH